MPDTLTDSEGNLITSNVHSEMKTLEDWEIFMDSLAGMTFRTASEKALQALDDYPSDIHVKMVFMFLGRMR